MFLLEHVFVHNLFNIWPVYLPAGFLSEMYYGEDIFFYCCGIFMLLSYFKEDPTLP